MAGRSGKKSQIALEFIIVYSIVLVVFIAIFTLIASQRATILSQQQGSFLQLMTQSVASQMQQAVSAGSGYSASITLPSSGSGTQYNLYISSTGLVLANATIGSQVLSAQSYSGVMNPSINGTMLQGPAGSQGSAVKLYRVPTESGSVSVYNYLGTIYVDSLPPAQARMLGYVALNYSVSGSNSIVRVHDGASAGGNLSGARVGIISLQGDSVRASSGLTDQYGNAILAFTPSNTVSAQNVSVYSTVLGNPTANSLVSWFPLTFGTGNVIYDLSANGRNGTVSTNSGNAVAAQWIRMPVNHTEMDVASLGSSSQVKVVLGINTSSKGYNTVSFWMRWNGSTGIMPFAMGRDYDLYMESSCIGFNTGGGDNYGTPYAGMSGNWTMITAVFYNGHYTGNSTIYVNGVQKSLSQCGGSAGTGSVNGTVYISGWGASSGYRFKGYMSNVQVYNGILAGGDVAELYGEGIAGAPLPSSKLVGWWPLYGSTRNYANGSDGTPTNMSFVPVNYTESAQESVPNLPGNYGTYASKIDYLDLGVNSLTLSGVDFSVSQWFMLKGSLGNSNTLNSSNPIVDIYNGSTGGGIGGSQNFDFGGAWAGGTGNRFSWGQYGPVSFEACSTPAGTVLPGVWYDAVVTVSDYSNVTIYLNGARQGECTLTGASASTLSSYSKNLMLGINDNPVGSGQVGNSYVSDVQVYSTALTEEEVQQLYGFGRPYHGSATVGG